MRNLALSAIILIAGSAFVPAQGDSKRIELNPGRTQAVQAWLASRAIPLKSLQAGSGFEDLKPLKSIFKDVRILGLGEASHGQREFFQFKLRLFEFLVTEMGYDAFSLESSFPACMKINEYVMYGTGDPKKALTGQGFSQFDTEEVLEMIEWMRAYNSKKPEDKRVKFLGYDMQAQYSMAYDALLEYFKKVAPDRVAELDGAYAAIKFERGKPNIAIVLQPLDEQTKSLSRLNNIHASLVSNREKFVKATSQWDFDVMLLHARVLEQTARFRITMNAAVKKAAENKVSVYSLQEFVDAAALRDVYMAENAEAQLKMLGPKARLVLGGHNGHVQLGPWGEGIPDLTGLKIPSMGGFLRKRMGDAYYALGFDFDRGSFAALDEKNSYQMAEFTMPPAREGSIAWYLKSGTRGRDFKNYLVDLRTAPKTGPVAEWLSTPLPIAMLTGAYSKDRTREASSAFLALKHNFDGMLFVEETTRARPVPK